MHPRVSTKRKRSQADLEQLAFGGAEASLPDVQWYVMEAPGTSQLLFQDHTISLAEHLKVQASNDVFEAPIFADTRDALLQPAADGHTDEFSPPNGTELRCNLAMAHLLLPAISSFGHRQSRAYVSTDDSEHYAAIAAQPQQQRPPASLNQAELPRHWKPVLDSMPEPSPGTSKSVRLLLESALRVTGTVLAADQRHRLQPGVPPPCVRCSAALAEPSNGRAMPNLGSHLPSAFSLRIFRTTIAAVMLRWAEPAAHAPTAAAGPGACPCSHGTVWRSVAHAGCIDLGSIHRVCLSTARSPGGRAREAQAIVRAARQARTAIRQVVQDHTRAAQANFSLHLDPYRPVQQRSVCRRVLQWSAPFELEQCLEWITLAGLGQALLLDPTLDKIPPVLRYEKRNQPPVLQQMVTATELNGLLARDQADTCRCSVVTTSTLHQYPYYSEPPPSDALGGVLASEVPLIPIVRSEWRLNPPPRTATPHTAVPPYGPTQPHSHTATAPHSTPYPCSFVGH